jgi:Asp-tRNA(Asn)/Glu-tRNA(Gln) amidotransferase A subunit family amidase
MSMSRSNSQPIGAAALLWLALAAVPHSVSADEDGAGAKRVFDLGSASIADINAAIDAGALTSEKLVGLYLQRIEAYDKRGPKINAVITLNPAALDEARALDAERESTGRRSPLHGIPIVIKDLIDKAGMPTTAGFAPFGNPIPPRDAPAVARLQAAGAIVLAKVSTVNWFGSDGFGATHPIGATLNPYNAAHSPGGSSNGTGASMAAWFAAAGLGTDTGGSVQNPSANNSLYGMVSSQGLVSRTGVVPRSPTHDRVGPMGRSVYDIALVLGAMSGFDPEDRSTYRGLGHYPQIDWVESIAKVDGLRGRRIGVLREAISVTPEDPEVMEIFSAALDTIRAAGAEVVDPVLSGIDLKAQIRGVSVSSYEAFSAGDIYLARLGPQRPYKTMKALIESVGRDKFSSRYVAGLDEPTSFDDPDFARRYRGREAMRTLIEDLADRYDLDAFVILYRSPPVALSEFTPEIFRAGVLPNGRLGGNLTSPTGLPGVIVPAGYTSANLPIALQILGKSFSDHTLLEIARGYEVAFGARRRPDSTPALPGERFEY